MQLISESEDDRYVADGAYSRWFRQVTLTSSLWKSYILQSHTFVYTDSGG